MPLSLARAAQVLGGYDGGASIRGISERTGIKTEDIISTLQHLNMIKYWKGQHVILVSQKAIDENRKAAKRPKLCDPTCLKWTPQQWT